MSTERIIEAVWQEFDGGIEQFYGQLLHPDDHDYPLTTALVNLAMSGVCPWCGLGHMRKTARWDAKFELHRAKRFREREGKHHPDSFECDHPYHDAREALEALIAERG